MISVDCPDVREIARGKWRVRRNPDAQGYSRDPWDFRIVGKRGHICPWGPGLLAVCIDKHPVVCGSLLRQDWVIEAQHGDDGVNAVFRVGDLDRAIECLKPYVKRTMSEAQRAASAERLKSFRDN